MCYLPVQTTASNFEFRYPDGFLELDYDGVSGIKIAKSPKDDGFWALQRAWTSFDRYLIFPRILPFALYHSIWIAAIGCVIVSFWMAAGLCWFQDGFVEKLILARWYPPRSFSKKFRKLVAVRRCPHLLYVEVDDDWKDFVWNKEGVLL